MLTWREAIFTALAAFIKVGRSRTLFPWNTFCEASQNIAQGFESEGTF